MQTIRKSLLDPAVKRAKLNVEELENIAFFVLAPLEQIETVPSFTYYTAKENIKDKVIRRINAYEVEAKQTKKEWFNKWLCPALEQIQIECLGWEEIIYFINGRDSEYGNQLEEFYSKCLLYNGSSK